VHAAGVDWTVGVHCTGHAAQSARGGHQGSARVGYSVPLGHNDVARAAVEGDNRALAGGVHHPVMHDHDMRDHDTHDHVLHDLGTHDRGSNDHVTHDHVTHDPDAHAGGHAFCPASFGDMNLTVVKLPIAGALAFA
jgi:hypothetical protein